MKIEWTEYDDGSAQANVGAFSLHVPPPSDYERGRNLFHSYVALGRRRLGVNPDMQAALDCTSRELAKRKAERLMRRLVRAAIGDLLEAVGPALSMLESDHLAPATPDPTCAVCELRRAFDAAGGKRS